MDFSWMAWTPVTALFFAGIAAILLFMGWWQHTDGAARNEPRVGILGIATQRGDRLFLSLLGSAFIHLAWLAVSPLPLWWASFASLVYAALVFRFV